MSKLRLLSDLAKVPTLEDFKRYASIAIRDIYDVINGQIEFDLNIQSKTVVFNFTSANTDFTVAHDLAKVPRGYEVTKASAACSIYDGTVPPTENNITLRSNAIATVEVRIF